jgi:hypothetical protein
MAKRPALIAFLCFLFLFPALAKADSFVSVVVQPNQVANFYPGDNILQISFVWNTTDGILSDFDLVTSPGAPPNFPAITPISFSAPSGTQQIQGSEIFNITLAAAPNALFTLEERAHNDDNGILSTPGTRQGLETLYICDHCDGRDGSASLQIWGQATSTVTSFADDPVSTPEPGSLILLGAGLAALALAVSSAKWRLTASAALTLALLFIPALAKADSVWTYQGTPLTGHDNGNVNPADPNYFVPGNCNCELSGVVIMNDT